MLGSGLGRRQAWSRGRQCLRTARMAGAEEPMADQVAYWVNQNTQNAEMTLEHDGQPVQVSVSLSGNEAHVYVWQRPGADA